MTPALARLKPPPEPAAPIESFDTFLGRNVRRAPLLALPAIAFVLIRATGARAGAVLLIAASAVVLPMTLVRPEVGLYALILNFVNEWDTYYKLQSYLPISLPLLFDVAITLGIVLRPRSRMADLGLNSIQLLLLAIYVVLVTVSVLVSDVSEPRIWTSFRKIGRASCRERV